MKEISKRGGSAFVFESEHRLQSETLISRFISI